MRLIGAFLLFGILFGCNKTQPTSLIVAKVGDSTLNQEEVDYRLQRFSEAARQQISQNKMNYAEFIESIAYAKLMANKQWKNLSKDQRKEINLQVDAYRIDLLSKMFLSENIPARQPDITQVEEYYNKHIGQFTAKEYQIQIFSIIDGCSIMPELLVSILDEEKFNRLVKSNCSEVLTAKTISQNELEKLLKQQIVEERHAYWVHLNQLTHIVFIDKTIINTKSLSEAANEIKEILAVKNFKEAFDGYRASLSEEIELLN